MTPFYDPLLAKLIVWGETRSEAVARLASALDGTRIAGIETNLGYLRHIATVRLRLRHRDHEDARTLEYRSRAVEVLSPGTQSTIQDYPGRLGYWDVGIPPSGPMDSLALRLANRAVGNPEGAPALEMTMTGPTLTFRCDARVALAGAPMEAALDGEPAPYFTAFDVRAGQTLAVGAVRTGGARTYLCVEGGFDVPEYLGSRSTFTLGGFGGHGGRALRTGDVLRLGEPERTNGPPEALPSDVIPSYGSHWDIGVLDGPHGAPDFFTEEDIEMFYEVRWKVHYNSARTGVRLIGPKPSGRGPTAARRAFTPRTFTTTPTRSAPSISRETCRSFSVPMDRASAGSSVP